MEGNMPTTDHLAKVQKVAEKAAELRSAVGACDIPGLEKSGILAAIDKFKASVDKAASDLKRKAEGEKVERVAKEGYNPDDIAEML